VATGRGVERRNGDSEACDAGRALKRIADEAHARCKGVGEVGEEGGKEGSLRGVRSGQHGLQQVACVAQRGEVGACMEEGQSAPSSLPCPIAPSALAIKT
jgi:hypothetical protein